MKSINQAHQAYIKMKTRMYNPLKILLPVVLVLGITFTACEGPAGPEGPQGEQGQVGPTGEGSMMYAGEGEPSEETGDAGDYYLNQNTGELYGPKVENGWGEPGIVLMGEDGEDGEDGSQIHSGDGSPEPSLGQDGDFYLDKSSYDLYGPKTSSGWGSPVNLKGAKGNANVTRYIFLGNNFTEYPQYANRSIPDIESIEEMKQSIWLAYIINISRIEFYYQVPGRGIDGTSEYRTTYYYETFAEAINYEIILADGLGEDYEKIEIVRIRSSNTEDFRKMKEQGAKAKIPDHLDVSDYEAVAKHYGFWNSSLK